jgi:hypothetical protein
LKGKRPVVNRQPPICMTCHGVDPRPNWQSYRTWPGFYASEDDRLDAALNAEEYDELRKFVAGSGSHPRYKHLLGLVDQNRDGGKPGLENGFFGDRRSKHSNGDLTDKLALLNFQRLSRIIRATPDYGRYKYMILGSVSCARTDKRRFMPVAAALPRPSSTTWAKDKSGFDFFTAIGNADRTFFDYVFASRGVPMDYWSMNFEQTQHGLYVTGGFPELEFAEILAGNDPDLLGLSCDELALKSREMLQGMTQAQVFPSLNPPIVAPLPVRQLGIALEDPAIDQSLPLGA